MRKPLVAVVVLVAVGAAVLALGESTVFAHSRPVRLDPQPGAILQSAPAQVQGWFTADLRRDPNWTFIRVVDGLGNRVDTGETQLSANRRQMTVALRPGLPVGRYIVTWRTWDEADGAIFGDCYVFFVGQAAADQALADNLRLDAGRNCERIDVSARDGTPMPGQTPVAVATQAAVPDSHTTGEAEQADDGDSGGGEIPVWALVLGIAGGLAVGLVGGRVVERRS